MGITERVLAEHSEPAVPPLPKRLSASLTGEPPGQAVAGIDEGQLTEGMSAPADDPVMLEVGPQNLGQQRQIVLLLSEEPAAVAVADTFMVRGAADDEPADVSPGHAEAAGRAASRLDGLFNCRPMVSKRGADRAERWHRVDQGCRAPAGQNGEPSQRIWRPVADPVVDSTVLAGRTNQVREVADGEVVGVGEAAT
ncbi:hypothetical protein [Streptomyces sp. NPDC085665]|uniref:hypothetical protein n=1 Tax=Streptomyces sp. NPDC085665 TaxID=3365735 RepID=UPI0037D81688